MKKKLVFIGDLNSINLELIVKSHKYLQNKTQYILLGSLLDLKKDLKTISNEHRINSIYDPINFEGYKKKFLNVFDIQNISNQKYKNMINQIKICNYLSSKTKIDLVTMPINKSVFKKKIKFNGMTEYLGEINNKQTIMLMHGNVFSVIPLTTHINLKNVNYFVKNDYISKYVKEILTQLKKNHYYLKFKKINFLCINPHCSENQTIGNEDIIISNTLKKFKDISGPYSADSAFISKFQNKLFISMYHDQALIPFKIINKKSINLTLGLDYRRLSPAHGTALDIKSKGIANNLSYLQCMTF